MPMPDIRFPIGPLCVDTPITEAHRRSYLAQMKEAPDLLRAAVQGLAESQLDTPYRADGWTVRQVVHHLADANLNWYTRTKFAITEDQPTIKPFNETAWAGLADACEAPIEASLMLIDGLQTRWLQFFESLGPNDWPRVFQHPERGPLTLDVALGMMAWHNRHHTAHITELRKRMGW
jgi:uncharacterized damage-inducible protein DinB